MRLSVLWKSELTVSALCAGACRSRAKNAQEAHEAIRPTKPGLAPGQSGLQDLPQLQGLYSLIWSRALACQMAPAALLQVLRFAALPLETPLECPNCQKVCMPKCPTLAAIRW